MKKRDLFSVTAVVVFLGARAASANDPVDASSKATAEALFKQARQLMSSGRYAAACPKLAESQRLDPAAGTLLNLGECFEKNGQTASAWATFGEAARAADLRKRADWRATADAHVRELEPLLSYLVLEVDLNTASAPELSITCDGNPVRRAAWSAPIPTDPGPHVIAASAAGRTPWRATIDVQKQNDRAVVHVPRLASSEATVAQDAGAPAAPYATATKEAPAPGTSKGTTQRTVGLVIAGVGVVGLGTGLVFGLLASGQASKADTACPKSPCTDRTGLDANDHAHTYATVSTIGVIAGGVLAATGVAIWLWPSGDGATARRSAPHLVTSARPSGGELSLVGTF